jgi:hypothetical protein
MDWRGRGLSSGPRVKPTSLPDSWQTAIVILICSQPNARFEVGLLRSVLETLDPYRDCPGATRVAGPSTFSPGQFR